MNNLLTQQFVRGVSWNFVESVVYRAIFLIHHLLLFKVVDTDLYGSLGTLFSILYLTVAVGNLGLDNSISVFYKVGTASRYHFKAIYNRHLIAQLIIFSCIGFLFAVIWYFFSFSPLGTVELPIVLIMIGALICEGIKKTLRTFLQYAFLNTITATVEIVYLTLYVVAIWGTYAGGIALTMYVICLPFLCMSALSTMLLALYVYRWYQQLPQTAHQHIPSHVHKRFIKNRILNTINNIGRNLFTSNFLVALFAFKYGLQHAAGVKVLGTISGTLASLIYKTFSRMSNALLSHIKHLNMQEKQKAFSFLTHAIHQGMYCSVIFLIINYRYIFSFQKMKDISLSLPVVILLLALPIFDHLFIAYERFYMTEEKTKLLIEFNLFAAACLLILVILAPSSTVLTFGLLAIRLVVFYMMSSVAYSKWKIAPNWQVEPKLICGSFFIALLFMAAKNWLFV